MRLRKKPTSKYYHVCFSVRGRSYCRSTGATDRSLALRIGMRIREEILAGRYGLILGKETPLDELVVPYLDWLQRERSPKTVDRAAGAIRKVLSHLGVRYADEITRGRLARYRHNRQKEVAVTTVALELRQLNAFLWRSVREGWIPEMPCQIEMPRLPSPGRVNFLAREEVEPFLSELPPWAKWAAHVILHTGLRAEEARFLEWGDLDFESRMLYVRTKNGFSPKHGKGRSIPISAELLTELSIRRQETGYLCEGPRGGQFNRWTFIHEVRAAGRRAHFWRRYVLNKR